MRELLEINNEIRSEVIGLRENIHRNPELGNEEFKTAELIESYLASLGIETCRPYGTAVVGRLKCGEGKTVAFRADMDALPVEEATGAAFASERKGIMHACGHDVHTASVLGAAKILSGMKDRLNGTVVFIFQPDEEGSGGARKLIEAGVLADVDAVFGAHVDPAIPEGCIGIRYGKFYAASDMFDVTIKGKSAHGASPEKGIDALAAAALAVSRLRGLPQEQEDRCVVSTGMLKAGTVRNVIADEAFFAGIIRSLGEENRSALKKRVCETIESVCAEFGSESDINLIESYAGIVNTDNETAVAEATARRMFGDDAVFMIEEPLMTTEDFGYYISEKAGSFYHIGAGCSEALHSPCFLPSEEALIAAVRMHAAVACEFLGFKQGDI
ncbi:MAG: amidohydrolase [Mogibacterium sp.]|nr:amidohydrolase [Mogibacterium sp.]